MVTYIPIVASCVSMVGSIVAIFFAIRGGHRTSVSEIEQRAKADAVMNMKLDNINNVVTSINQKIEKIDDSVQIHSQKLIVLEESLKSLHKRVDKVEQAQDRK